MGIGLNKVKNVFWRVCFFAYVVLYILGISQYFEEAVWWTASLQVKLSDLIFCIIKMIGFYGFTYQKQIFQPIFWKIFFPVLLIWHAYMNAFVLPVTTLENLTAAQWFLIDISTLAPVYAALFMYAFKSPRRSDDETTKLISPDGAGDRVTKQ